LIRDILCLLLVVSLVLGAGPAAPIRVDDWDEYGEGPLAITRHWSFDPSASRPGASQHQGPRSRGGCLTCRWATNGPASQGAAWHGKDRPPDVGGFLNTELFHKGLAQ
jgi:hypothetical protein